MNICWFPLGSSGLDSSMGFVPLQILFFLQPEEGVMSVYALEVDIVGAEHLPGLVVDPWIVRISTARMHIIGIGCHRG